MTGAFVGIVASTVLIRGEVTTSLLTESVTLASNRVNCIGFDMVLLLHEKAETEPRRKANIATNIDSGGNILYIE